MPALGTADHGNRSIFARREDLPVYGYQEQMQEPSFRRVYDRFSEYFASSVNECGGEGSDP